MEHFIVSARKYRPQRFDTILGQDNIAATLKNSILRKQLAHAYLFCGPRGVGKTTCARIFAKTINCLSPTSDMEACGVCESCLSFAEGRSYCIHELDAASNNSVEDIRQLIEKVRIPPQIGNYSVYIIDEVHMLSQSAFNAFLKTLEEPPAYALFILATTEKHKILPTILSRCQTFDFNRISVTEIVAAIKEIAQKESVQLAPEAMHVLALKADGAMRDALTLYDQTVAFCGNNVSYQQVISNLNVLDYEYYFRLTNHFLTREYADCLSIFDEVLTKGFNALHFIAGLSSHFRDLLVSKNVSTLPLLELSDALKTRYAQQAQACSFGFIYEALKLCAACEAGYKASGNPRLHIEFTLIRLSHIGFAEQPAAAPVAVPSAATPAPAIPSVSVAPSLSSSPLASTPATTTPAAEAPATPLPPPENHSSKGFSINAMLKKEQQRSQQSTTPADKQEQNTPFNLAQLLGAWDKLAEAHRARPRLCSTLVANKPSIENESNILFEVESPAHKEWIEQNCMGSILSFLKEELKNNALTVTLTAKLMNKEDKSRLYMPEEKAKFLVEQHPEVRELKKDLNLDIN